MAYLTHVQHNMEGGVVTDIAIINAVKERYTSDASEPLPPWNDTDVRLTIKNYDIGDTLSGEFKLVGE